MGAAGVIGSLVLFAAASPARGVVVGNRDDFQNGTVMEWFGGDTTTNLTGGAAGASDRFLNIQTVGGASSGSHLATHNAELRWAGDYIGAGVTGVSVDLINRGNASLTMRLVLFGQGNRWTSIDANAVTLAVGGGWQHVTFPISQTALTRVLGTGNYTDSITQVTQIMFRHDPGTPSSGGTTVNGMLGIDNVTALPAPGAAGVLVLGGLAASRRRRVSCEVTS